MGPVAISTLLSTTTTYAVVGINGTTVVVGGIAPLLVSLAPTAFIGGCAKI